MKPLHEEHANGDPEETRTSDPVVEQLGRPGVFRIFGDPRVMAKPLEEILPLSYWSLEEGRRLGYDQ